MESNHRVTEVIYARLAPCCSAGWLRLLAEGWSFSDPLEPRPIVGPHSQYSILMVRPVPSSETVSEP